MNERLKFSGLALAMAAALSCSEKTTHKMYVAVASGSRLAIMDICREYQENTRMRCELSVAASGKLAQEIKDGKPYDIFFSSNMQYPQELQQDGLTASPVSEYGEGALVLWSKKKEHRKSLTRLHTIANLKLAVPDPKVSPYGKAAVSALKYYKAYESLKRRIVWVDSVYVANQQAMSGHAHAALTSLSTVVGKSMKSRGDWKTISKKAYEPIKLGMVVLANGRAELADRQIFTQQLKREINEGTWKRYRMKPHTKKKK